MRGVKGMEGTEKRGVDDGELDGEFVNSDGMGCYVHMSRVHNCSSKVFTCTYISSSCTHAPYHNIEARVDKSQRVPYHSIRSTSNIKPLLMNILNPHLCRLPFN